jgi:hypothetical protein
MRSRNTGRRGQGLVELALVLPLVILLASVLIDLALLMNAQHALHRVTSTVVDEATLCVDGRYLEPSEIRQRLLSRLLPPLVRDRLMVDEVTLTDDTARRRSVNVQVRYRMPLFTPGISLFMGVSEVVIESKDRATYPAQTPVQVASFTPPPFTILASGDIQITRPISARMKVLRKSFRRDGGGSEVPITLDVTDDGRRFDQVFGGSAVNGGEEMVLSNLEAGDKVALRARFRDGPGRPETLRSNRLVSFADRDSVNRQHVLANGDVAPDHPSMRGQPPLSAELAPFVDTSTASMKLGRQDVLLLIEGGNQYGSAQTDFQDLVVLLQFYDPATQGRPVTP